MRQKIFNISYLIVIFFWIGTSYGIKELPSVNEINPPLFYEAIQTETNRENFSFPYRGNNYEVTPQADYEQWGLIVTQNNINGLFNFYKDEDEVNLKDICVVWGKNIKNGVYLDKNIHFSSGEFSCYADFTDNPKNEFHLDYLANNHLLSADREIQEKILNLNVGDQVYIRGNLVDIKENGHGYMKTSLSRTDSNSSSRSGGACEVFYVDELEILKQNKPFWNLINTICKYLFFIILFTNIVVFVIELELYFNNKAVKKFLGKQ